jgi:hypothetical protein
VWLSGGQLDPTRLEQVNVGAAGAVHGDLALVGQVAEELPLRPGQVVLQGGAAAGALRRLEQLIEGRPGLFVYFCFEAGHPIIGEKQPGKSFQLARNGTHYQIHGRSLFVFF